MSAALPATVHHLLDEPNFGHLATLLPDGSPQSSVVWVDRDGDTVVLNTAKGRVKHRNIERDSRVSLSVHNRDRPTEYVEVRGRAELIDEGADEHIDALAMKYLGKDVYPFRFAGQERVIIRIVPDSLFHREPTD